MSKALVLGGGGSVGTAWETGLMAGLGLEGMRFNDADLVLGTSAGAAVGVQVACGHDMMAQVERYRAAAERVRSGGSTSVLNIDDDASKQVRELFDVGWREGRDGDPAVREQIARVSRESTPTIPLEDYLRTYSYLKNESWPESYRCTCLEVDTATFRALDHTMGGSLMHGVAAACAVPGHYPPVEVAGGRYADGGSLSPSHLDLAAGHEVVVFLEVVAPPEREIEALRAAGTRLLVVRPDAESLAAMGDNFMLASAAFGTVEEGLRQGQLEAERVRAHWTQSQR